MYGMYKLPDKSLLRVRQRVDKLMAEHSRLDHESMLKTEMARAISHEIAQKHLKQHDDEYTTDYYLDVYVLTPDELMKLIREEASKYYLEGRFLEPYSLDPNRR